MDQFVYHSDLITYLKKFMDIRELHCFLKAFNPTNVMTLLLTQALDTDEGLQYGYNEEYFKCTACKTVLTDETLPMMDIINYCPNCNAPVCMGCFNTCSLCGYEYCIMCKCECGEIFNSVKKRYYGEK